MLPTFTPEKEQRILEKTTKLLDEGWTLYQISKLFGLPEEWYDDKEFPNKPTIIQDVELGTPTVEVKNARTKSKKY